MTNNGHALYSILLDREKLTQFCRCCICCINCECAQSGSRLDWIVSCRPKECVCETPSD